jgi:hypothetical protein
MAATIAELFAGRTETIGTRARAEVAYAVFDAADEAEVRTLALASTPIGYLGLPRSNVMLEERINATTWRVRVIYEAPSPSQPDPGGSTFSFDTGGGTQHITQSLQTVARYGPSASSALGGAIGYDGQNVNGVDITVPVYQFSETHQLVAGFVNQAYQGALFALTGTVNQGYFRGLQPGECLFLGASGSKRGADLWEITYKFAGSPNRSNLQVGAIGPIQKGGWEYLWVQYGDDVDAAAQVLIKKPIAVYVEQVYPSADFAGLGIGT